MRVLWGRIKRGLPSATEGVVRKGLREISRAARGGRAPETATRRKEGVFVRTKLQACAWLPAAEPPPEWLAGAPWAGTARRRLWRGEDMRPMGELWTVGAVAPLLSMEALALPSDRTRHV